MGRLTTHVLDLTRGLPAAGMTLELASLTPKETYDTFERLGLGRPVKSTAT